MIGIGLIATLPLSFASAEPTRTTTFDPIITLEGVLPPGSLGLPGEPITWIITVTNMGAVSGTNLVISDTLQNEMRVEAAQSSAGAWTITDQNVVFTVPVLQPGETAQFQINATVLRSPTTGVIFNQAVLTADGSNGKLTWKASAEVFVPTSLPATGYAPIEEDLPGEGEPSALEIGMIALSAVMVAAAVVWYRGRRWW